MGELKERGQCWGLTLGEGLGWEEQDGRMPKGRGEDRVAHKITRKIKYATTKAMMSMMHDAEQNKNKHTSQALQA